MGPIEQSIKNKLEQSYHPILIDVENESHKHASKMGDESHFRVVLVSESFKELKRIERSRNVHELLHDEIKKIHALSLRLFSPEEWGNLENKDSLLSPNCTSKLR